MNELVYVTQEQRDLILKLFGGVRAETDDDARRLLAELEQELGVKGAAAVFRKALALAKKARGTLSKDPPHVG